MTEKIFNRSYIEKLYSANYFGSSTDYSDEEIERNKERWIEEMKLEGWNLGDTILLEYDYGKDILNVDKEGEFDKACEKALEKISRPDESEEHQYEEGVPCTGDEIHFTDGTIWSVLLFSDLYPLLSMESKEVIFVPMSFEQMREQGFVKDYYFVSDVKGVLKDALKGGAKIVRGVGVKK
jgi:hypothetical protein